MSGASTRSNRTPPRSVEEALRRAAGHGRLAASEAVAAARAVLDAAALGLSGETAEAHASLATLAHALDDLEAALGRGNAANSPLFDILGQALDTEISRWEQLARRDREARGVLRAFLGLRELLWEVGVRGNRSTTGADEERHGATADGQPQPGARADRSAELHPEHGGPPRVQRIRVQGR